MPLDFYFIYNSTQYTLQANIINYIGNLYTNYRYTPYFYEMINTLTNKNLYIDNDLIFNEGTNKEKLFWAYYTNGFSNNSNRKWYAINTSTTNILDYFNSDQITSTSIYTARDLSNTIFL